MKDSKVGREQEVELCALLLQFAVSELSLSFQ